MYGLDKESIHLFISLIEKVDLFIVMKKKLFLLYYKPAVSIMFLSNWKTMFLLPPSVSLDAVAFKSSHIRKKTTIAVHDLRGTSII